jgi:FkbM family methyltransferase
MINSLDNCIKHLLKNKINPIFFDVGANKGQSINRFLNLYLNSLIHSFEPNIDFLNIPHKKNVFYNNYALGSKKEYLNFNINLNNQTSSFLELNNSYKHNNKKIAEKKILVDTLDNYIISNSINKIDYLKIDTQGFEAEVLRGASSTLNITANIEIELTLVNYYKKKSNFLEIEILLDNKFEIFSILPRYNLNNFQLKWCDVICTKK